MIVLILWYSTAIVLLRSPGVVVLVNNTIHFILHYFLFIYLILNFHCIFIN